MPLFQQSVIRKHIESFDAKHIEEKWVLFKSIFHSPEKQSNIRNSKEEQYQEGFLRDLFVQVLGYTINPEPNFNLLTEQKNVNNSKKADGAIVVDGKAIGVIELKGTETTDLNKIEIQAFGYKNNQPGCNYVITSNFEKLRFYIDNTTQQEEFNLFTLTKAQFELLYACLAWESIKNNTPTQILNESVSKENIITKSLYKDYSEFKRALFANMVELNPQFDKLVLFKKTQKLLDRFLFIFFAEDRGLLPTNLIFRINKEWENIIAQRISVSLFDRYKMYFNDLNVGAKVTLPAFGKKTGEAITAEFEIFAYNGGLFVPDEILDNIAINDTLLHSYTQKMSHYNFESDVDVNILGHIFENSLNEIDEIKSEIEGNVLEKTKTRRKKDGVFYTPKYITKYIIDNTIGKLCTEKKEEMKLLDEEYITDKKIQTKTKKALLDKLNDYRNWLLDLTICDPACGSGAFLNQALEFLIAEHRYVDELQAKLLGDSLILSDIENSILERNIYGVDLNDESVEIAKLSLWLRTAQKGRKLNSLNNNIKCGNSLIDDPAVAGDKAFSWEKEFPEVFAKGGFDVVIGNPPYVRVQNLDYNTIDYYKRNYKVCHQRVDLYLLFFERGFSIINQNGILSFINPTMFINSDYGIGLRKFLKETSIVEIIDFGDLAIFEDAITYTGIFTIMHKSRLSFNYLKIDNLNNVITSLQNGERKSLEINDLSDEGWTFSNKSESKLLNKLSSGINIGKLAIINSGCFTGFDEAYFVTDEIIKENNLEEELIYPVIMGKEPKKYFLNRPIKKSIYPYFENNGSSELIEEKVLIEKFPKIHAYLSKNKNTLLQRKDSRKTFEEMNRPWHSYTRKGLIDVFNKQKIIVGYIVNDNTYCLDENKFMFSVGRVFAIVPHDPKKLIGILGILNSKLSSYQMKLKCPIKQGGYFKISSKYLSDFSIPKNADLQKLAPNVISIQDSYKSYNLIIEKLTKLLIYKYSIIPSQKIESWHSLSFNDFIKELNKAIKAVKGTPLTKKDEFEWMDLFEENKKKALELKAEIDKMDKEIDGMVYELYGLSEEEIRIVEGE
ncbi:MAG: DNA methyltransferase [Bacteroidota bacterium]